MRFEKNQKRVINAWALYDWANSVYFLVISTAVFPVYFLNYSPEIIRVGSIEVGNSAFYSFVVSFSYILIAVLSPILSGIADYGGRRKLFMKIFTLVGSLGCMALFFFESEATMWLGTLAFVVATIGCTGSIVFYNAYLPIIATEDKIDSASAKGYAYGYIGSVILLLFILVMIQKPEWFAITDSQLPARIGFLLVGLWWWGFAQVTFHYLPKDTANQGVSYVKQGLLTLRKVFGKVRGDRNLSIFLLSFFFYFSGVQTVIYVATIFAKEELAFESADMIIIVLLLQVVAIAGAYLFSYLSKLWGNRTALIIAIISWMIICVAAFFVTSKSFFFVIAGFVGLAMGGIQPLSRSTFSKMIPAHREDITSYFSFYDVLYKLSIVLGTFSFGFIQYLTGSLRNSVLGLLLFFCIGLFLMCRVALPSRLREDT